MSQRGALHYRASDKSPARRWVHIRGMSAMLFTLALSLGTAITLIAQEDTSGPHTVTLRVDGTERQVTTFKTAVQTFLQQEGVILNAHDRCEPPVTAPITDGMTVVVHRITCETVKRREAIPAPTVTRWNAHLSSKPLVARAGTPGMIEETSTVWKKDGVVAQQWVSSRRTVRRPTPTILLRGRLSSRSGLSARRIFTMVATAYDPGPSSCGRGCTGHTALGLRATRGVIAVDPRIIPLGARVFVDGYGLAIAADTGGAIHGKRIDVCFDSRREALHWGRRTVQVMVLE